MLLTSWVVIADWASDGVTEAELAGMIYGESATWRNSDEASPGGNPPPDPPGAASPADEKQMRKDMATAVLCREFNDKDKPKDKKRNAGTAAPSPNLDTDSPNPDVARESKQSEEAAQEAKEEFDGLSEAEKKAKCGVHTHFWHECYTYDGDGKPTQVYPAGTPSNPDGFPTWIDELKAGDGAGGSQANNGAGGGNGNGSYMCMGATWDVLHECWMYECGNVVPVAY